MIFTRVLVFSTLLSLITNARASTTSLRKMQETSLGAAFLAVAKNYTPSSISGIETKSGYFSVELEASAIGPLGIKVDPLCEQFDGYVESQSKGGNETVTTSYSVTCRFPVGKYDAFEDAVVALLEDYSYSYSFSSYVDSSYSDPAIYVAQQKALENIMVKADTIADLMLVVSSWQGVVSSRAIHLQTIPRARFPFP